MSHENISVVNFDCRFAPNFEFCFDFLKMHDWMQQAKLLTLNLSLVRQVNKNRITWAKCNSCILTEMFSWLILITGSNLNHPLFRNSIKSWQKSDYGHLKSLFSQTQNYLPIMTEVDKITIVQGMLSWNLNCPRLYLFLENKSFQLCTTTNSFFRKKKPQLFYKNENYFVRSIPKDRDGRVLKRVYRSG